jgi:hypothetical protein
MRRYRCIALFLVIAYGPVFAVYAGQSGTDKSETKGDHGQEMVKIGRAHV